MGQTDEHNASRDGQRGGACVNPTAHGGLLSPMHIEADLALDFPRCDSLELGGLLLTLGYRSLRLVVGLATNLLGLGMRFRTHQIRLRLQCLFTGLDHGCALAFDLLRCHMPSPSYLQSYATVSYDTVA